MTEPEQTFRAESLSSGSHDIFTENSWLQKTLASGEGGDSNQSHVTGRVSHLLDWYGLEFLRERNVHHGRCLVAKSRYVSSGGFRDAKIAEVLGPLCEDGLFQPLLDFVSRALAEFHEAGIEVVYTNGKVTGLNALPPKDYWVVREEESRDYHYEIRSKNGFSHTTEISGLRFARFGDREEMVRRLDIDEKDIDKVSEVIRFTRDKHVLSEDYGTPEWMSGIPYMELETCQVQYRFDFFFNGCLPDGIYTVSRGVLNKSDWDELLKVFHTQQGPGNRRKLMCVNIGGEEVEIQFDKLDSESEGTNDSESASNMNALAVVTAHGVPPLIAGIQVPGKIGAANEFPTALQAFHAQYAGPVQVYISAVLACSLGKTVEGVTSEMFLGKTETPKEPDPEDATGVKMKDKDLRGNGFWTILDSINLGEADTVARMKTPLAAAQAEGRDVSQGLRERGEDAAAGRGTNS